MLAICPILSALAISCGSGDEGGSGGAGTSASSPSSASSASAATSGSGPGSASSGAGGGAADETWGNFAQGFFATYCVECHDTSMPMHDYATIDDVKVDKDLIRCGVSSTKLSGCGDYPAPEQFPIDNAAGDNPKPDLITRSRLVSWIDAGLPE